MSGHVEFRLEHGGDTEGHDGFRREELCQFVFLPGPVPGREGGREAGRGEAGGGGEEGAEDEALPEEVRRGGMCVPGVPSQPLRAPQHDLQDDQQQQQRQLVLPVRMPAESCREGEAQEGDYFGDVLDRFGVLDAPVPPGDEFVLLRRFRGGGTCAVLAERRLLFVVGSRCW